MSGGTSNSTTKCGLYETIIFLLAIIFGTACSICSKTMMSLHGIGLDHVTVERFDKPIFQTLGMFIGMIFGLFMHFMVLYFRIPFPGYDHLNHMVTTNGKTNTKEDEEKQQIRPSNEQDALIPKSTTTATATPSSNHVPIWMYFFLAIPSIFDLGATVLCMMGLRHLDVSIYQLLRGSGIIFVALMKQHVLGDTLYKFQWIGVAYNVVSVVLVGMTAVLNTASDADTGTAPTDALIGVTLVMAGAFVQALQFVFEEKVMTMEGSSAPPLLLIGMEGFWGTLICLLVVYPIAYYIPGDDHGSYEDPYNTWEMLIQNRTIQIAFVIYFFTIFFYNVFAVLVTFSLNSIWHAILDNFRPITVWCTNMLIYYVITNESTEFGEPWTPYSYIQALGMVVLLYGTAIYNAPNAGSILLNGSWYSLFIDLQYEYTHIESVEADEQMDIDWEQKRTEFLKKRFSSMAEQRSPHISIHTQALGATLGSQHM